MLLPAFGAYCTKAGEEPGSENIVTQHITAVVCKIELQSSQVTHVEVAWLLPLLAPQRICTRMISWKGFVTTSCASQHFVERYWQKYQHETAYNTKLQYLSSVNNQPWTWFYWTLLYSTPLYNGYTYFYPTIALFGSTGPYLTLRSNGLYPTMALQNSTWLFYASFLSLAS